MKTRQIYLVLAVLLSLLWSACKHAPSDAAANDSQVPFSSTATNSASASDSDKTAGEAQESASSEMRSKPEAERITIPGGTVIAVRLQNSLSSASSHAGDEFSAVLAEPIVVNGATVATRGAEVRGRVTQAKSSGRLEDPGYIGLTLTSVAIRGRQTSIETSSVFAKGSSHKKRNVALIGGGTGAGAVLGGIFGGGKGALIGAAAGAGAGTAGAYATGKKDVGFSAEHRLSFRLKQGVTSKS